MAIEWLRPDVTSDYLNEPLPIVEPELDPEKLYTVMSLDCLEGSEQLDLGWWRNQTLTGEIRPFAVILRSRLAPEIAEQFKGELVAAFEEPAESESSN